MACLMVCFGIFNVQAQTDVTATYLQNAGFDTDFTYDVSAIDNHAAGDSENSVAITGWTLEGGAVWSSSASFAYGTAAQINGATIPASGYNASAGGALGISVGWGGSIIYSQSVNLTQGKYIVEYAAYNSNTSASQGYSKVGWVPTTGASVLSSKSSFSINAWDVETLEFELTETTPGKIQIGLQAVSNGSGANAKVSFDYIKLTYYDVAAVKAELNNKISDANNILQANTNGYNALNNTIAAAQIVANNAGATLEEILQAINELNAAIAAYTDAGLSDLKVNGVTVPGFSPTKYEYTYTLALNEATIPVVTATTNSNSANTPQITGATAIPGTTTISVTAGDDNIQQTYTINFVVNYVYGWDYNGTNGTPGDAGWIATPAVTWNTYTGSCSFRTDLWNLSGISINNENSNGSIIFAYPVTLTAGKVYTFAGKEVYGSGGSTSSTYIGFNTSSDATGTYLYQGIYSFSSKSAPENRSFSFAVPASGTYYMVWNSTERGAISELNLLETGNAVIITFNSNGGSAITSQYLISGEKGTEPEAPAKEGFVFGGWYADQELNTAWNFETDVVTSDIILYAKWESATSLNSVEGDIIVKVEYYTLQGLKIEQPELNNIYIVKKIYASQKTEIVKTIFNKK